MKIESKIEELSQTKRKVTITVPVENVASIYHNNLKVYAQKAEIPGFRKGKAPDKLVKKFFGNKLEEDSINGIFNESIEVFKKETSLQVLNVKDIKTAQNLNIQQAFEYEAVIEVNPSVDIIGYKELKLQPKTPTFNDELLESQLLQFRRNNEVHQLSTASLTEDGYVKGFLTAFDGETEAQDLTRDIAWNMDLQFDASFQTVRDSLVGHKQGDEVETSITLPEDSPVYPGKTLTVKVKIDEVYTVERPEISDALAQKYKFPNKDALVGAIRQDILKKLEEQTLDEVGDQIVEQLLPQNNIEAPEVLIEQTIDRLLANELQTRFNIHLTAKNWKQFNQPAVRDSFKPTATREVQSILALGNIARMEKISVEDQDILPELQEMSLSYGKQFAKMMTSSQRGQLIEEAKGRALLNKTIKHLIGLNGMAQNS